MSLKNAKVLVLDAGFAQVPGNGKLNNSLAEEAAKYLQSKGHEVKITHMPQGYKAEEEVEKFNWADVIFFQTPVWNMSLPGPAKQYFDAVLGFYNMQKDKKPGKHVIMSGTFGTPEAALNSFHADGAEQVWWTVTTCFKFAGIEKFPSVSFCNVMGGVDFNAFSQKLHEHLDKYLQ